MISHLKDSCRLIGDLCERSTSCDDRTDIVVTVLAAVALVVLTLIDGPHAQGGAVDEIGSCSPSSATKIIWTRFCTSSVSAS